ncbi:protein YgfX [Aliidiomarina quisquiliarum]|uniref:protein YgfX n=1 Tax=Aliidiomarina quisquiliarum TaxID=2938947 RepID=UPI00208DFF6E|nr:protein YgfX [Aliidiomarina quisquiliarum]MCO4320573.1 hypothetical protein [Aliidiomarina quisquiliarum]
MQRWQVSVAPSVWFQQVCFAVTLLALALLFLGMVCDHFSWLMAAVGLCVLALTGQNQRYQFFTLDANGQGHWGPAHIPFMLASPVLSTPWLLMLPVRLPAQQRWVFIWQDSVSEDNWCRLRRITNAITLVRELPPELK